MLRRHFDDQCLFHANLRLEKPHLQILREQLVENLERYRLRLAYRLPSARWNAILLHLLHFFGEHEASWKLNIWILLKLQIQLGELMRSRGLLRQLRVVIQDSLVAAGLCSHFEPGDQIVDHFAKEKLVDRFAARLVRSFEPVLVVAVYGRLPEELDEAGKIQGVIVVRPQKFRVDL